MSGPAALREGDGVAVVAPSSPFDRDRFERGVRALQDMGFEPRFGEGVHARHAGYLAGPDTRRLDELLRALRDPSARTIVLARGGYGLLRIARSIPPQEPIAKPVVGYSDATVLHELWWRAKMPSVHGPMCTQLGDDATALARLRALLYGAVPEPFDHAPGPLVRVQHPTIWVEHHDPLAERFQHRLTERREPRLGWETGRLLSR